MSGKSLAIVFLIAVSCWPVRAQEAGLLKDGDSAFANGDYDPARRSFEKALQIAGGSSARYGILRRLTSISAAVGQFVEAQRYLQQAIAGPDDPKLADDLVLSVNLDMRTKQYDHALVSAQQVQAMHVAAYTPESLPVADDLLRIGEIYLAQGKLVQAMGPLLDAHGMRTRLTGPLDPGLLPVLDRINEANAKIAGGSGHSRVTPMRRSIGKLWPFARRFTARTVASLFPRWKVWQIFTPPN
jgi:tetratricopeptide (TPR) repeat protein